MSVQDIAAAAKAAGIEGEGLIAFTLGFNAGAKKEEKVTLKYWDGRGLMEVARQCMAINGKFPGADYNDVRVGGGKTAIADVKDSLDANLGRMPICEVGGVSIGQGSAIHFYVASINGLMGASAEEAGQIYCIAEAMKEIGTAFRGVCPYGQKPEEEALKKWFEDDTANDYSGMANGANRSSRFLKWYMGRLEGIVGDGFAVGGKLSLADVLIYNKFAETMTEAEGPDVPAWKRAPFNDAARMTAALAAHPKLQKICTNVAANEGMKKWLAMRGPQGF